jgi:glycerophosphoryl diester phosphodiesterase
MTHHRPIVIAHRYGNEVARLKQAAEAGAAYVETDVWSYKGRLEVRHAKTLGFIPVIWDKWYVRRQPDRPLVLDDVLAALPPGMGVMLDLKGDDAALPEMILAALRRHPEARPVMVSARFWQHLPSLREYPGLMLFHSVGRPWELRRVRPLLDQRENDAICVRYQLLNAATVRSLKQQVSMLATWAINDEERLARAMEWGVDAIITDETAIMRTAAPTPITGGSGGPDLTQLRQPGMPDSDQRLP